MPPGASHRNRAQFIVWQVQETSVPQYRNVTTNQLIISDVHYSLYFHFMFITNNNNCHLYLQKSIHKMQSDPNKAIQNPITIIINNLNIVMLNMGHWEESLLMRLDDSVMAYLTGRKSSSNNISIGVGVGGNGGISDCGTKMDPFSMEGLAQIHRHSQSMLIGLQQQMALFLRNKATIQDNNTRTVTQLSQNVTINSPLLQICKQAIEQLSKYRDVQQLCHKLGECRKKGVDRSSEDIMNDIERYLEKMGDFVSENQEISEEERSGDEGDEGEGRRVEFKRIGKNGRVSLLLDFIE